VDVSAGSCAELAGSYELESVELVEEEPST
jgi:hypothetical protein